MFNHFEQLEVFKAKGSKIYLKNGDILIDGISSWWSVAHGYNNPHIIKSIVKQAKMLPHIMLAGFATEETYKLAHRLSKFANLDKVFFSDSGSTAVETSMKIAWQYFLNDNNDKKKKFISFKNSYHGDTVGAMTLADLTFGMHKKFKNHVQENFNIDLPKNFEELNKFEDFIKKNHEQIAGLFIEPIVQCAGGMIFNEAAIVKEIYRICQKNNILFIADECAVGFYRTGKKFAHEYADIRPDILVIGKALTGGSLTMSAVLVKEYIFNSFLSESLENALMVGPTFMGNALASAASNASLDLFEKFDYEKIVLRKENYLNKELKKFLKFNFVKSVRVKGLIAVIEMDLTWQQNIKLRKEFIKKGVFLRPISNCIYLMPSLNIKQTELQKILDVIYEVLKRN